jgi:hypothetical protein
LDVLFQGVSHLLFTSKLKAKMKKLLVIFLLCSCSPRMAVNVPKSRDAIDQFNKKEHTLFKVGGALFFWLAASYLSTTK